MAALTPKDLPEATVSALIAGAGHALDTVVSEVSSSLRGQVPPSPEWEESVLQRALGPLSEGCGALPEAAQAAGYQFALTVVVSGLLQRAVAHRLGSPPPTDSVAELTETMRSLEGVVRHLVAALERRGLA